MGSLGPNGGISWLRNTEGTLCFIYKQENETLSHFRFVCISCRRHFESLWANLVSKINNSNPTDGAPMSHFIMNLNQHHKTLLLLGCLPLPCDISTITVITRFIAAAIGKIYKIRTEKLLELEASGSLNSTSYVLFSFQHSLFVDFTVVLLIVFRDL